MTNIDTIAAFDSIQPDADMTTAAALKRPTAVLWSYRIGKAYYSCRRWSEVREVAAEMAAG